MPLNNNPSTTTTKPFTDWEVGKTYKMRNGDEAKITATNFEGAYPIRGIVGHIHNSWTKTGSVFNSAEEMACDLMPPGLALQDEPAPEFTLDWPHGHMTRDGYEVEMFCERNGVLCGRKKVSGVEWMAIDRRSNGRMYDLTKHPGDIINRPAPKPKPFEYVGWGIVNDQSTFYAKDNEESARGSAASGWRAVHVKITEIEE